MTLPTAGRIQAQLPNSLILLTLLTACNSDPSFSTRPIAVTILHTNDTHSHLEPFPRDHELSVSNAGPQQGGIARRKTLIDQSRADEPYVLLLLTPETTSKGRFSTMLGRILPRSWR